MSTNILFSLDQVSQRFDAARTRLFELEQSRPQLEETISRLEAVRNKYSAIDKLQQPVEQLNEIEAEQLFWGEAYTAEESTLQSARLRSLVDDFNTQLENAKRQLAEEQVEYDNLLVQATLLEDETNALQDEVDAASDRVIIEWANRQSQRHRSVMPWTSLQEDERRFKTIMLTSLSVMLLLSIIFASWVIPDREQEVALPDDRYVQLVVQRKKAEKPIIKETQRRLETPEKEAAEEDRQKKPDSKNAGIFAFSQDIQTLLDEDGVVDSLGSNAKIISRKQPAKTERKLISSNLLRTGDITVAAGRREVETAPVELAGIAFSRIDETITTGDGTQVAALPAQTRTDEEIQLVFDRYKSALYRIYNRELRVNPKLRGQLLIRLTIEADGKVSAVSIDSSDLDAPKFENDIVTRVKRFNFGSKADAEPLTILYPIEFLPVN